MRGYDAWKTTEAIEDHPDYWTEGLCPDCERGAGHCDCPCAGCGHGRACDGSCDAHDADKEGW